MPTKCCTDCFEHPWVKSYIDEDSKQTGQRNYCGSRRRRLLPIGDLTNYFENLASMYADDGDGVSLIDAVQDEWYVFSDKLQTSGRSRRLLEDMMVSPQLTHGISCEGVRCHRTWTAGRTFVSTFGNIQTPNLSLVKCRKTP